MLQCILIILILVTCVKGESLHLVPSGPSFRLDAGNNAILQCVLNGDSTDIGGSFSWTKDSGQTLSNTEDGHVTITLSDSGTVSTLTINGVHNGDEGRYTCSYPNVDTLSIMVEVNSDPYFKNVQKHQVLTEGTDAVVECPAFLGDPPGEMFWFRKNQFINDDRFIGEDGQLTIQNVRQEDAGTYECSLYRNGIVGSRDITVTVTVQEQSELAPNIVEHQNPIEVVYGEPLDLTCELVEAKNDVQYSWTIDTDYEHNHLANTTQRLHMDPNEFLGGKYTCRAQNQYGYDQELFFVKILAPPLPTSCSETPKRINEGETVVLSHCEIMSPVELSDLQFQWSKMRDNGEMTEIEPNGMKYSLNHEGLLTIVKAQPSDSGLYRVNISNDQGYALHSIQLQVVDPPTLPTATIKVTFEVRERDDGDHTCVEVQNKKAEFSEAFKRLICTQLGCSQEDDLEMTNSVINCGRPNSKEGTFTTTLRGDGAELVAMVLQQREFNLRLEGGPSLTLNVVCEQGCSTAEPQLEVQSTNTPGIVGGVIAAFLVIIAMVIGAIVLTVLFQKNRGKRNTLALPNNEISYRNFLNNDENFDCFKTYKPQNKSSRFESELVPSNNIGSVNMEESVSFDDTVTISDTGCVIDGDSLSIDQGYFSNPSSIDFKYTDQQITTHQSSYFTEAEKRAKVPFLDYKQLECDSNGLEYTDHEHDITIRIPEGAVPEGKKIHFEAAVTTYGPFIFPNNTQPISPILWLCILEEDVELQKTFQVVLPHYLAGLDKERVLYHQVVSAKASHNSSKLRNESSSTSYEFQTCEVKPQFAFNGYRGYGVLESNHCCFYCLQANQTPELAMDASYCLIRIESALTLQRSEVYFTAVYFLDSCLKSLEEQFSAEEGYRICRYDDFKFNPGNDATEPHIKVMVPSEHSQCVIGMEPMAAEIRATDIDFWRRGVEDMRRRHERKMYPPRVKMTVSLKVADTLKLPVKFVGCSSNNQLDVELTFPLGFPPGSPSSSLSSGSHMIICDKPKLKDVFKELLPLATYWKTIGTLLGIEEHILDMIKSDEDGAHDRLQKMISEWLKRVDPTPTWRDLADAVDSVDTAKAQEIRARTASM